MLQEVWRPGVIPVRVQGQQRSRTTLLLLCATHLQLRSWLPMPTRTTAHALMRPRACARLHALNGAPGRAQAPRRGALLTRPQFGRSRRYGEIGVRHTGLYVVAALVVGSKDGHRV